MTLLLMRLLSFAWGGVNRLTQRQVLALCLGLVVSAQLCHAQLAEPLDTQSSPWSVELEQLQAQLHLGENATVLARTEQIIGEVEARFGFYHKYLIDPLVATGDAYLGLGQPNDALKYYQRALQIERTETGPGSIHQQPILRKTGVAQVKNGDFQAATQMFEKVYELALKHHGASNPALIPETIHLLEWYQQYGMHFHAAILSGEVLKLTSRVWSPDDPRMLEIKRSFAKSARDALFPPQREFGTPYFRPSLPLFDFRSYQDIPPFYRLGTSVLKGVLKTLDSNAETDPLLVTSTMLDLADFYQSSRYTPGSFPLYREVWDALEHAPELRERTFSQPKLLYISLPVVSQPNDVQASLGYVELAMTVSKRGKVIGRRTIAAHPRNDRLEHRVRSAAKSASYRPAFRDGQPVRMSDVSFIHYYPLGRM